MKERINLLRSLPKIKRNVDERKIKKTPEIVEIARQYGPLYFDGPRHFGYGGYKYDGRWRSVARDIIAHYQLRSGMRVLDIGCAKGFLVKDLMLECPGLEAFGLDISRYAICETSSELAGRLHLGTAADLPFASETFHLAISINTIHNLTREEAGQALWEIQRVSAQAFVQVDSYETKEQEDAFLKWVITAKFHGYPDDWLKLFDEAGYFGDYDWTIVE